MSAAIDFYKYRLVLAARTLPLHEAVLLLRGALAVADNHPELLEIKHAHQALAVAEDQLEIIVAVPHESEAATGKEASR